jgi:hypothetical protein
VLPLRAQDNPMPIVPDQLLKTPGGDF